MTYRPNKMQKGSQSCGWVGSAINTVNITFPTPFSSIPTVVAVLIDGSSDIPYSNNSGLYKINYATITAITTTGFSYKIRAATNTSGNGSLEWIAWE